MVNNEEERDKPLCEEIVMIIIALFMLCIFMLIFGEVGVPVFLLFTLVFCGIVHAPRDKDIYP